MPRQDLPRTDEVVSTLFDMRLTLTFTEENCALSCRILVEVAQQIRVVDA